MVVNRLVATIISSNEPWLFKKFKQYKSGEMQVIVDKRPNGDGYDITVSFGLGTAGDRRFVGLVKDSGSEGLARVEAEQAIEKLRAQQ
jgi:hypothetical protein